MKRKNTEMWVGIFVVLGIILLVLMTLKIEKFQIGKKVGYPLHIYFDSAAGLDQNSPVRVAGVRVGGVEKVILEKGKAKVTFRIPQDLNLYKDAKAYLKSEGFLGEKYIEITPGTPDHPKVESGGMIEQGASPVDVEQFLSKISGLGEDLKEVIKPMSDLLKSVDPKNVQSMINSFDRFSGQLTDLAKDSKETIQKAKGAFSNLEDISEKVKKGEGTLGKLITASTVYLDVKKTVEAVKEAAESAKKTVDTFKNVSEKVERGEGTLGKLLNDDALIKETEKTMKKVQKAAEGIQEQTPITVLGTLIGLFF